MSEKEKVYGSKIKYGGTFKFTDAYEYAYLWLIEKDFDVVEDQYMEKITGPETRNLTIKWTAKKKFSDYFQYELNIEFKLVAMSKTEITDPNGKKISANKGTFEVIIKGNLIKDRNNKFDPESGWDRWMQKIYEKWILPDRIEYLQEETMKLCDDFLAAMRNHFEMWARR